MCISYAPFVHTFHPPLKFTSMSNLTMSTPCAMDQYSYQAASNYAILFIEFARYVQFLAFYVS